MPNEIDWKMLDDINTTIYQVNFEELNSITKMIKKRREILNKISIAKFKLEDSVEFIHNGRKIKGTIAKIKIKRISVKTDEGRWDVPANLLDFAIWNI